MTFIEFMNMHDAVVTDINKENVLVIFSYSFNLVYHGTEKMFVEYVNNLKQLYNVDLLYFGSEKDTVLSYFEDLEFRHIYTVKYALKLRFSNNSYKLFNTHYRYILFNDTISPRNMLKGIMNNVSFDASLKVWHSPFFISTYSPITNDDKIALNMDYNIFVSHYDYNWCLNNKSNVFDKDNSIILNNNILTNNDCTYQIKPGLPLKIIYYGRFQHDKGVTNFLMPIYKLITEGYNIQFDLYGHYNTYKIPDEFSSIEDIEQKTSNKIKFYKFRDDIMDIITDYDVSIISPYVYTNSLATQEAVDKGMPILSYSNVGVLEELGFKGNNLGKNIINVIKDIYNDKTKLNNYIINKNSLIAKFNSENVYNGFYYKDISNLLTNLK